MKELNCDTVLMISHLMPSILKVPKKHCSVITHFKHHWKGMLFRYSQQLILNPYPAILAVWPIKNNAKILKNHWNQGIRVLIWESSVRAVQWVPTWQGLDCFQKYLRSCASDESSLSIGRSNRLWFNIILTLPTELLGKLRMDGIKCEIMSTVSQFTSFVFKFITVAIIVNEV